MVYTRCQREVECSGVLFSWRVGDALSDVYELSERSGVYRCSVSWRVGDALSGVYELSERSGVSRCSVFLACWRCTVWCIRAVREKWSVPVFCFFGVLAMH